MASITDVATALGQAIADALYPAGAIGEGDSPVAGCPVQVALGWPQPQDTDAAMAAGKVLVSLYPLPGERNTTRYPGEWTTGPGNAASYTLTSAGLAITVGGGPPVSPYVQNLAAFVNGKPYTVQSVGTETVEQLAASLQARIVADVVGTTVSGAVITLPPAARAGALRVGTTALGSKEVRRQERRIQIIVWAPTPELRDAVDDAFDPVLADTPFLTLADGSTARLHFVGSQENDFDQKQGIWRRDRFYTVEYATQRTDTFTQAVVITTNLQDSQGALIKSTST